MTRINYDERSLNSDDDVSSDGKSEGGDDYEFDYENSANSVVQPAQKSTGKGWIGKNNAQVNRQTGDSRSLLSNFTAFHWSIIKDLVPSWPKTLSSSMPTNPTIKPAPVYSKQPEGIVFGTLKNYQLTGIEFLRQMYDNGAGCILGDEM